MNVLSIECKIKQNKKKQNKPQTHQEKQLGSRKALKSRDFSKNITGN